MDINSVFYGTNSSQSLQAKEIAAKYSADKKDDDTEKTSDEVKTDNYTKSENTVNSESGIYSKDSIKKTLKEMEAQRTQAMQSMISEMLGKQANAKGLSIIKGNTSILSVTQTDIDDAKSSISDGGYWSVDSVAGRIMDMAKNLAGGDATKFDTLKNAVIKGFGGAAKSMGKSSLDEMPDITRDTYDEVMKRFDKWQEELNGTSSAE